MSTNSDLPLFPDAFVGWRSWTVGGDGRLHSLTSSFKWPVGKEATAKCGDHNHRCPAQRCVCGIYALKSLIKLRQSSYFGHDAFGQVALWGRILEGEDGFRAEFAYPKVIYVTYMNVRLVEPLSVYGVPVKLMNPRARKSRGDR